MYYNVVGCVLCTCSKQIDNASRSVFHAIDYLPTREYIKTIHFALFHSGGGRQGTQTGHTKRTYYVWYRNIMQQQQHPFFRISLHSKSHIMNLDAQWRQPAVPLAFSHSFSLALTLSISLCSHVLYMNRWVYGSVPQSRTLPHFALQHTHTCTHHIHKIMELSRQSQVE